MNIRKTMKSLFAGAATLASVTAVADETVVPASAVPVEPTATVDNAACQEPWTTVKVDYTLAGLDKRVQYKVVFDITALGETRSVTNEVDWLGDKSYTQTFDTAALFGEPKTDPKATAEVSLIAVKVESGVQLWENGPYWATCNVGASDPYQSGYYFWWGDTVGYVANTNNATRSGSNLNSVTWESADGKGTTIKFDRNDRMAGKTYDRSASPWITGDNLKPEYDAAQAHLHGAWRMPREDEISKLTSLTYCNSTWTNLNGVAGRLVRGNTEGYKDKSVFFPAVGYGNGASLNGFGSNGYYWSSTPYGNAGAHHVYLNSSNFNQTSYYYRYYGYAVRPVRDFAE